MSDAICLVSDLQIWIEPIKSEDCAIQQAVGAKKTWAKPISGDLMKGFWTLCPWEFLFGHGIRMT